MMTSLTTALQWHSASPAIIIPETDRTFSYKDVKRYIDILQSHMAEIGVFPGSAVTMSLMNGLEFVISFLAIAAQRAIAAPLNPSYQQNEVEFYVDDIKAVLILVPKGALENDSPAVRAARKFGAGIAEIWWDGETIRLDLKVRGNYLKPKQPVVKAGPEDVAVTGCRHENLMSASFTHQWNNGSPKRWYPLEVS